MGDDVGDLIVTDLLEQGFNPAARLGAAGAMQFVGHGPQVGVSVIEVQPVNGILETVFGQIPDPDGAIGDDEHPLGLAQAPCSGLIVKLLHQRLDPAAGGHVAALGDHGAEFGFEAPLGTAVVEPETGGRVNPMPTLDLLLARSHFSSEAPMVAFADVPGVNLDNQRKGFWGRLHNWGRFDLRGWGDEPGRVEQALAHGLGALSLPLGFAGQSAPAQRAPGHAQAKRLRLLGGHLGNEQGAHLLHQGRGGRVVPQPQHPVDGKNPLPAMGAPAMGAEQFDFAAIGINPPGHATLLVAQRPQAIGALFIGLVGLGLHGFLHEQPLQLQARLAHVLLDEAQALLGMLLDLL